MTSRYSTLMASIYLEGSNEDNLVCVGAFPVSQFVSQRGEDLVFVQLFQKSIVDQDAVYAEEAISGCVAVACSSAAVDYLNSTNAEPHVGCQFINTIAEGRGIHGSHFVEKRDDHDRVNHVGDDGENHENEPQIQESTRTDQLDMEPNGRIYLKDKAYQTVKTNLQNQLDEETLDQIDHEQTRCLFVKPVSTIKQRTESHFSSTTKVEYTFQGRDTRDSNIVFKTMKHTKFAKSLDSRPIKPYITIEIDSY